MKGFLRLLNSSVNEIRLLSFSGRRCFAAKAKKGDKGGGKTAAATAEPTLSKEVISKTVVGANINKEGSDPAIKPDSEYPDWLWTLLDKEPSLSSLKRKPHYTMSYYELNRLVTLENRRRIKERNHMRSKK
eukprot:TRINITY_DN16856_c0_g1_i1.p1 TRINITY_DN16856_c0_g1~~TRINITY_DN16856_c0_g1_i1.p1  ORF type:complete len:131 (+),score=14.17 TRINITY_DN16856_c0_g1_i1:19-411(+)